MVPASQNVLLVVLWAQSLILLAEHLLKKAYVGPDEYLDQIRSIEVMIELLDMVLVASRFDFCDNEALVLLDGLLN